MRFPHSLRLWLSVLLAALTGVCSVLTPVSALAWATPQPLPAIPENIMRPHIAGDGHYFHVVFQQDSTQRLLYSRGTTGLGGAVTWAAPIQIATGVRYAWNVTAANGKVHVAYSSTRDQMMYLTNTQSGDPAAWSTAQKVATLGGRTNDVDIALDAGGTPYIAWGEGTQTSKLVVAYLTVSGVWSRRDDIRNFYLVRSPQMVVSGSGDSATIHIMTEFQYRTGPSFYIGYTKGSRTGGLTTVAFSQSFANVATGNKPTIALDPSSGTLYTGFVNGSLADGFGLQFSYSLNNGQSWVAAGKQSLGKDLWVDLTPMAAERGTAYLMLPAKDWDGTGFASIGFYDVRYTLASNSFSAPQPIRSNAGTNNGNANPDYDMNYDAKVGIWATDNIRSISYNSDPGGRLEPISATMVVNGGAASTTNPTVTIQLQNVVGNPTTMRVTLDGDPTDATPAEPFQSSFTRTFGASSACQRTVAIQLSNSSGGQSEIIRAGLLVDAQVQASVLIGNPYKRGNTSSGGATGIAAVDDGDSGYTREPKAYVEINATSECSGISKLRIGHDATSLNQSYTISGSFFAGDLPLPAPVAIGQNTVVLELTDILGNVKQTSGSIIYDPIAPVLTTPGTLTVSVPIGRVNILTSLAFEGNVVSDTIYPGRGFWGIWLANSRTAMANPANDPTLTWSAVAAPGSSSDVVLTNWSILGGLPVAQQTPGTYYVYARFLDGAGNPTSGVISSTLTITEVRRPLTQLPIIVKN